MNFYMEKAEPSQMAGTAPCKGCSERKPKCHSVCERYKAQKPLIVTSNIGYEKLKSAADIKHQRIYDRIIDMCVPVAVEGRSMRRTPSLADQNVYQVDTASFDVSKYENSDLFGD